MFILAKGSVEVVVFNQKQGEKFVQYLLPGNYFGEVALLFNCLRTATVRANNYCTIAELSKENFDEMIMLFP